MNSHVFFLRRVPEANCSLKAVDLFLSRNSTPGFHKGWKPSSWASCPYHGSFQVTPKIDYAFSQQGVLTGHPVPCFSSVLPQPMSQHEKRTTSTTPPALHRVKRVHTGIRQKQTTTASCMHVQIERYTAVRPLFLSSSSYRENLTLARAQAYP